MEPTTFYGYGTRTWGNYLTEEDRAELEEIQEQGTKSKTVPGQTGQVNKTTTLLETGLTATRDVARREAGTLVARRETRSVTGEKGPPGPPRRTAGPSG